jgi:hypothetical protein
MTTNETTSSFDIVVGYLQADYLPAEVSALRLAHRCSVLMASSGSDTDANFDHGLYLDLLERAFVAAAADEAVLLLENGKRLVVSDTTGFAKSFATPPGPKEPFPEVMFLRSGTPTALVLSEPYALIGGPPPYNDRYALSFFSDNVTRQRFLDAVKNLPSYPVVRTVEGSAEPVTSTWRKVCRRVASLLGVRPSASSSSVLARTFLTQGLAH